MTRKRKKIFVAWLANMTDRRDDEPMKIRAFCKRDAEMEARNHWRCRNRFNVSWVMTWAEFRSWDGWWARRMGKDDPIEADDWSDWDEEEEMLGW